MCVRGQRGKCQRQGVLETILFIKCICEALAWGMTVHLFEQLLNDIAYDSDGLSLITEDDNETTLTPFTNMMKHLRE
ncbi:hypothetical protein BC936DRAFT_139123 [Jimgerdemannia flammicorona]|uniref:Uncharacterized protein n=1 Tax=Jimgerdemannia flammicorona TaxID=994334 RepID=A0A433BAL5_9FUNG|nr:hypothetical protein BC936DRAFT_139123 [Jimgerdemannia flammicorona]